MAQPTIQKLRQTVAKLKKALKLATDNLSEDWMRSTHTIDCIADSLDIGQPCTCDGDYIIKLVTKLLGHK